MPDNSSRQKRFYLLRAVSLKVSSEKIKHHLLLKLCLFFIHWAWNGISEWDSVLLVDICWLANVSRALSLLRRAYLRDRTIPHSMGAKKSAVCTCRGFWDYLTSHFFNGEPCNADKALSNWKGWRQALRASHWQLDKEFSRSCARKRHSWARGKSCLIEWK